MRDLDLTEFKLVGGGCSPCPPSGNGSSPRPPSKNNNGFGNGAESGPAPGMSGTNASASASGKQNNDGTNRNFTSR